MNTAPSIPWNAYPALIASGCFAAGICAAEWFSPSMTAWSLAAGLCAVGAGAVMNREGGMGGGLVLTLAALGLVATAGGIRHVTFQSVGDDHVVRHFDPDGEEVELVGRVNQVADGSGRAVRMVVQLDRERTRFTGRLQVTVRVAPGSRWRRPSFSPEVCDLVRIRGRTSRLPRIHNPGDFDYGGYLRRRQIYLLLHADARNVEVVGRSARGIDCIAESFRSRVGTRLDRYVLHDGARSVMKALILGDRRSLDPEVRERFARTGLLHLLAVSGLHVMVVGMILYRLLRPALMRAGFSWRAVESMRSTLTAALLLAYLVITGASASVARAAVMTLLFMAATTAQRPSRPFNTLGVAMLAILAVRPAHLFEPGFQLSSAAVASIVGLTPQLSAWIPAPASRVGKHLHAGVLVTAAASIGTLPIVLGHFGQAALGSLVLNVPAVPITTAALSSGIAALAAGEVAPFVGETLGASADFLAGSLLYVSEAGDRLLGWSLVVQPIDQPSSLIAISLAIVAVGRWRHPRHRWRLLIASASVLCIYAWAQIIRGDWVPSMDVVFFDVGHGDAVLLRMPDGSATLIDAGPRSMFTDAGRYVLVPQLERLGVRRLRTVVVTHPDSDHLGGIPTVLRSVRVDRIVRSGFQHTSRLFDETNELVDSLGIPQLAVTAGDTLSLGRDVRGYVLHPIHVDQTGSSNESSTVLQIRFGATSILLTGDAPAEAERSVLSAYRPLLESDVLKVGHHGSKTSSSSAFLKAVRSSASRPPFAVISVARNNGFGLPNEDVVERVRRTGFQLQTTGDAGAIWLRSDGRVFRVVDWRQ